MRKWKEHWLSSGQHGQAIIMLALFMVVLVGFVGLGIDGGRLYFLKRDAQNAADAAALRGALAVCQGGNVEDLALAAAAANGFDNDGVTNRVTINNPPPVHSPPTSYDEDPESVEAVVTGTIDAMFVQIVYPGDLEVPAVAVAKCSAGVSGLGDSVIWANGNCGEGTYEVDLRANNTIINGDIHSNGQIVCRANNNLVNDGIAAHVDGGDDTGTGNTIGFEQLGGPTDLELLWDIEWFEPGVPGGMIAEATKHDMCGDGVWDYHSSPGTWRSSEQITGTHACGVYYVDGDIVLDTDISGTATFVASGTIEVNDNNNDSNILEPYPADWVNCDLAPEAQREDCRDALPLPLLFSAKHDECGQPVISLRGNNSIWRGAIYAPYGEIAILENNGTSTLDGALIGYTVDIAGNGFTLGFDAGYLPALAEVIVLQR